MDQACALADRAVDLGLMAEVLRDAQQLALGVADVDPRETALVELADDRVAGKAVLDLSKSGRSWAGGERRRADPHPDRVTDGSSFSAAEPTLWRCSEGAIAGGRVKVTKIDVSIRYIE
jgi:hypothetical protein